MRFWNRNSKLKYKSIEEASKDGDLRSVKHFLKLGDCNSIALHYAAANDHLKVIDLLLKFGMDVNYVIPGGGTPLMAAAGALSFNCIALLIKRGADPNLKGVDGRTPLMALCQPGAIDVKQQELCILALLEGGADIDCQSHSGSTALMKAAWFGNDGAAKVLIENGADKSLRDAKGRNAAMLAFQKGHQALANALKDD